MLLRVLASCLLNSDRHRTYNWNRGWFLHSLEYLGYNKHSCCSLYFSTNAKSDFLSSVKTPYYSSSLLIENNGVYMKVYAKVGLILIWNQEDALMVCKINLFLISISWVSQTTVGWIEVEVHGLYWARLLDLLIQLVLTVCNF